MKAYLLQEVEKMIKLSEYGTSKRISQFSIQLDAIPRLQVLLGERIIILELKRVL